MATPTTSINVKLTSTYALTADSHNFVIESRRVIDPTRAPGYSAESTASTEVREVWRAEAWFSLTSAGLSAALDYVRMRTVTNSGITDLAELVALIRDTTQDITDALRDGAKLPRITVEIDA